MKYFLILLLLTVTASARIGETPEECVKRYGKPTKIVKERNQLLFKKAGFLISVQFLSGKAGSVFYVKSKTDVLDRPLEISPNERQILLKSNAAAGWEKSESSIIDEVWINTKNRLSATYNTENILVVISLEKARANKKKRESKEEEGLKGF